MTNDDKKPAPKKKTSTDKLIRIKLNLIDDDDDGKHSKHARKDERV